MTGVDVVLGGNDTRSRSELEYGDVSVTLESVSSPEVVPGDNTTVRLAPSPLHRGTTIRCSKAVPERSRPSADRAAAAARLAAAQPYVRGSVAPDPYVRGSVAPDPYVSGSVAPDPYVHGSVASEVVPSVEPDEADGAAPRELTQLPADDPTSPPKRHLRILQPRQRTAAQRRRRAQVAFAVVITFALGVALSLVYLHVVLSQRQFRLDRLDTRVQAEQSNYEKLRLQVAQLGSPANIIATAQGRLGMVQPINVTYLPSGNNGQSTTGAGGATLPSTTPGGSGSSGATVAAPSGDADWPLIKSQLAGSP